MYKLRSILRLAFCFPSLTFLLKHVSHCFVGLLFMYTFAYWWKEWDLNIKLLRFTLIYIWLLLFNFLLNLATAYQSIFVRNTDGQYPYKLKSGVHFHLYINTAPCGDARIFSPHENDTGVDKHPNRLVQTAFYKYSIFLYEEYFLYLFTHLNCIIQVEL